MNAYMYVCMCVRMYAYMVLMYVCMYVSIYVCMYVCMYTVFVCDYASLRDCYTWYPTHKSLYIHVE